MSKKLKLFLISFVILSLFCSAVIYAAGSAYSSEEDPLVSLSFLTQIFKPELQSEIREANDNVEMMLQSQIDSLKKQIATLTDKVATLTSEQKELLERVEDYDPIVIPPDNGTAETYEILTLKKGDVLIAEEICELVLRSGSATVISPFADQGILDCTEGRELLASDSVLLNHFILIPRGADGRGITILSDTAYVMIKGAYSVVEK